MRNKTQTNPLPESRARVFATRMIQRTRPQAKTGDLAFPIRVKLAIPHHDRTMWWGLNDRLTVWLKEIGPLRCVQHSGGCSVRDQRTAWPNGRRPVRPKPSGADAPRPSSEGLKTTN